MSKKSAACCMPSPFQGARGLKPPLPIPSFQPAKGAPTDQSPPSDSQLIPQRMQLAGVKM